MCNFMCFLIYTLKTIMFEYKRKHTQKKYETLLKFYYIWRFKGETRETIKEN